MLCARVYLCICGGQEAHAVVLFESDWNDVFVVERQQRLLPLLYNISSTRQHNIIFSDSLYVEAQKPNPHTLTHVKIQTHA